MKISVAVATYNGEKYIKQQLDSIIQQLSENDEIIVSDDGSNDCTKSILAEYTTLHSCIKVVEGPEKGIISNIANAMAVCTGDVIFLSDQDDVWIPGKVSRIMREFENPDVYLVMHDAKVVKTDLETVIMPSFFKYRNTKPGAFNNWVKNSYMGCCMAFRSAVKERALPIPTNIQMHDQWIGILADHYYGKSVLVPEQYLLYRRHDDNVSDFDRNSMPKMIRNRIVLLKELLTRYLILVLRREE